MEWLESGMAGKEEGGKVTGATKSTFYFLEVGILILNVRELN